MMAGGCRAGGKFSRPARSSPLPCVPPAIMWGFLDRHRGGAVGTEGERRAQRGSGGHRGGAVGMKKPLITIWVISGFGEVRKRLIRSYCFSILILF